MQRKKYDFSQTPCPHLPAACAFQITSTKTHGNVRGWHLSLREFRITICRVFANHIFLLKNCLNILLCQYTWFYVIHFKVCKKFDSLVVSYFLKNFYCYSITVVCILFFYKYFPVYKIWGVGIFWYYKTNSVQWKLDMCVFLCMWSISMRRFPNQVLSVFKIL